MGGNDCIEERLPERPEIELKNINAAAVPDACLTVVQPKKIISGDRKIPPPVPVKPESKPIKAPPKKATIRLTSTIDFFAY